MTINNAEPYGEDVRGMRCSCEKGRCGDGHYGCYYEALFWQKRKDMTRPKGETHGG